MTCPRKNNVVVVRNDHYENIIICLRCLPHDKFNIIAFVAFGTLSGMKKLSALDHCTERRFICLHCQPVFDGWILLWNPIAGENEIRFGCKGQERSRGKSELLQTFEPCEASKHNKGIEVTQANPKEEGSPATRRGEDKGRWFPSQCHYGTPGRWKKFRNILRWDRRERPWILRFAANYLKPGFFVIERLVQDMSSAPREKMANVLRQVRSTHVKLWTYSITDLADPCLSLMAQIGMLDRLSMYPHWKPNLYQLLRHSWGPEGSRSASVGDRR